jgi:hypothetical protein
LHLFAIAILEREREREREREYCDIFDCNYSKTNPTLRSRENKPLVYLRDVRVCAKLLEPP